MSLGSNRARSQSDLLGQAFVILLISLVSASAHAEWTFTEVSKEAGLIYEHGFKRIRGEQWHISGGAASEDYNGDGWPDLFVVRGDIGPNLLFINRKDGTFEERSKLSGISDDAMLSSGPAFADIDGDGTLDLVVGGFEGTAPRVLMGTGYATFHDHSASAGLDNDNNHYSYAFADFDRDGDLDLAAAHWDGTGRSPVDLSLDDRRLSLWRNDGDGVFTDVSGEAGARVFEDFPYPFTPNFVDIDSDGWLDLLVAADFGSSFIMMNDGDGTFTWRDDPVLTDENGMGGAIGDYDQDGDLDWFVSSIWDPEGTAGGDWGTTGNRLYKNRGDGTFEDATDEAGVREGYWGWGSCFCDLNNDGHLDLFHVNGFGSPGLDEHVQFHEDPSRLFINRGNGTFDERSLELGIDDTGQGRGVVCFDYDMDGDIDLFVANNQQAPALYRNDGGNALNFLSIRLEGNAPNTQGVGARIYITAGETKQLREMRAGNNYVSSNPVVAHFGLGEAESVDEIRVVWPNGDQMVFMDVAANQFLVISQATSMAEPFDPHERTPRKRSVRRGNGGD